MCFKSETSPLFCPSGAYALDRISAQNLRWQADKLHAFDLFPISLPVTGLMGL